MLFVELAELLFVQTANAVHLRRGRRGRLLGGAKAESLESGSKTRRGFSDGRRWGRVVVVVRLGGTRRVCVRGGAMAVGGGCGVAAVQAAAAGASNASNRVIGGAAAQARRVQSNGWCRKVGSVLGNVGEVQDVAAGILVLILVLMMREAVVEVLPIVRVMVMVGRGRSQFVVGDDGDDGGVGCRGSALYSALYTAPPLYTNTSSRLSGRHSCWPVRACCSKGPQVLDRGRAVGTPRVDRAYDWGPMDVRRKSGLCLEQSVQLMSRSGGMQELAGSCGLTCFEASTMQCLGAPGKFLRVPVGSCWFLLVPASSCEFLVGVGLVDGWMAKKRGRDGSSD